MKSNKGKQGRVGLSSKLRPIGSLVKGWFRDFTEYGIEIKSRQPYLQCDEYPGNLALQSGLKADSTPRTAYRKRSGRGNRTGKTGVLCVKKDVLDQCPIDFDEILQVFDVEIPKPKEQVEQEQDVD